MAIILPRYQSSPHPQIFQIKFVGKYRQEQVIIKWQQKLRTLSPGFETLIDNYWQQTVTDTSVREYVFDGELAALDSWQQQSNQLQLNLFPTKYRRQFFAREQYDQHSTIIERTQLANALGLSIILTTSDRQIILMQRSQTVGESPGKIDVVGGHIEPVEHDDQGKPNPFVAMQAEMLEEINYIQREREQLYCLGLIETVAPNKPELFFYLKSQSSARDILRAANKISCNEFERLFTVPENKTALEFFIEKELPRLSPSALGVLWAYSQCMNNQFQNPNIK